ncbi:MAG: tRNA(Met) cytidine acetyltransferase [Thiotrichaceae bacterium]|nr:tRNA(Met) cytidine acetyltransferase [Thiotrichaceae bacterium]
MKPRQLIIIEGEEASALALVAQLLSHFDTTTVLQAPLNIKQVLGKEYSAVVYNTYRGLDPDLLGALGGTIIAGGVLLLICPPFPQWLQSIDSFNQRITSWPYQAEDMTNYFLQRFIRLLIESRFVQRMNTDEQYNPLIAPNSQQLTIHCHSVEQESILYALHPSLQQNASTCAVISADRGRGKSALLGQLAKQAIAQGMSVIVTAPSRLTAQVVFDHADTETGLVFHPVDALCLQQPKADLLLVDEAATIPSNLLKQLLTYYPHIIFATTVHGYEGTGRGFVLRFQQYLDHQYPHWQAFSLTQAIRYAKNDPLEAFLFSSLLLNTAPVLDTEYVGFDCADCEVIGLSSAELVADEDKLREVFGLFVLAHYQTRPKDLRHLLDGMGVRVVAVQWQDKIIATALIVQEGGFDPKLAQEIYYGRRRPQGHLIPQSLAVHAGIADAPLSITDRIMRIVVHPCLQRQGLGSLLLTHIAKQSQVDTLSTSFGASVDLLDFWQQQGYQVVRMGLHRDASSGRHAAIMLRANNPQGHALLSESRQQFKRYFPIALTEPLHDLEADIVTKLMPKPWQDTRYHRLNERDKADLFSYTQGCRQYECCLLAIKKFYYHAQKKAVLTSLDEKTKMILEAKINQGVSWIRLVEQSHLQGKKSAMRFVRESLKQMAESGE